MNGITYFKKQSPYEGDVTKGCGLLPEEVDNNFFVLEGRDVKSVTVEGNHISIQLYNGDIIKSGEVFENYAKDLSFSFDEENGVLTISMNGQTQEISGFKYDIEPDIIIKELLSNNDETINGDGTKKNPLSLSPLQRTGQYKPVLSFINTNNGETLPDKENNVRGDRYIVSDTHNVYGMLYNYDSVHQIACDLVSESSQWRIPTKEDWDDMLNAVEPNEEDRVHDDMTPNKYLGKWAGNFLKSRDRWINSPTNTSTSNEGGENTNIPDGGCDPTNPGSSGSVTPTEGQYMSTVGTDKFGFAVVPAGFADDCRRQGYFGERAAFWTSESPCETRTTYIKRFDYDRNNVYQDIIPNSHYSSIRLVKDYDGTNFNEIEDILNDKVETVLMPSVNNGHQVWTKVNLDLSEYRYNALKPQGIPEYENLTRYYIVEWDGEKWITNRFNEGEAVIILNDKDGKYNTEYRLINGVLTSVSEQLVNEVINSVQETLDNIQGTVDNLSERVSAVETDTQSLNERLEEEIVNRTNADNALSDRINTISDDASEIRGMLPTQEGSEFNHETGVLSIKSKAGTNDLEVQFSFNFGQI